MTWPTEIYKAFVDNPLPAICVCLVLAIIGLFAALLRAVDREREASAAAHKTALLVEQKMSETTARLADAMAHVIHSHREAAASQKAANDAARALLEEVWTLRERRGAKRPRNLEDSLASAPTVIREPTKEPSR